MGSPTQRSLKWLRDKGYKVAITEHWNQWAKVRQDLFGFVDLLAVTEEGMGSMAHTLAVQTTSYSNMSARITKIRDSEYYHVLKQCGWLIQVHGWKKNKSNRWEVKIENL